MPLNILSQKTKNTKRLFACVAIAVVAIIVGVVPAYAASISDLLTSIFTLLFSTVLNVLVGAFEIVINLLLTSMSVDIDTLRGWGFLNGFITFGSVIRALGVGIASFAILWQLTTILFSPYFGASQPKSVGRVVASALIFIPLSYVIQDIGYVVFQQMQSIYNAILAGYSASGIGPSAGNMIQLTRVINPETFLEDLEGTAGGDIIVQLTAVMSSSILAIVSQLLAGIFTLLILWNFMKLVMELGQRFVAMIVYIFLSPLAAAAGVIGDGEISRKSISVFMSSGVLWILNVWCVGIGVSLVDSCGEGMRHGVAGTLIWGVVTYGFLRIAQQLDDVFNLVGASNATLHSGLLDAMMGVGGAVMHTLGGIAKGVGSVGRGLGAALSETKGASPKNPITPVDGHTGSPRIRDVVAQTFANTKAGRAVKGYADFARFVGSSVWGGGASSAVPASNISAPLSSVSKAMGLPQGEQRNAALKSTYTSDKKAFNSKTTIDTVGKGVLGLEGKTDSLTSLKYNPQTGSLQGLIAHSEGDAGHVSIMKASGLEDIDANNPSSNHRLKNEVVASSATYAGKDETSMRLADYKPSERMAGASLEGGSGQNYATVDYKTADGVSKTLQVERSDIPGDGFGKFNVISSDGTEASIVTPEKATAEDVGRVLTGTAEPDVVAAFNQAQEDHGDALTRTGSIQARMGCIGEDGGVLENSIRPGTTFENSPNTTAVLGFAGNAEGETVEITTARTARDLGTQEDTWTAYKNGESIGTFTMPVDSGAVEAATKFSASEELADLRSAAGVGEDSNPTIVFQASEQALGPEPMAPEVPVDYSGMRESGITLNNWQDLEFSRSENNNDVANLYLKTPSQEHPGLYDTKKVSVEDFGTAGVDGYRDYGVTYTDDSTGKTVTKHCYALSNSSLDSVATAFLQGDFDSAQIAGFEDVSSALHLQSTYTQAGYKTMLGTVSGARARWRTALGLNNVSQRGKRKNSPVKPV